MENVLPWDQVVQAFFGFGVCVLGVCVCVVLYRCVCHFCLFVLFYLAPRTDVIVLFLSVLMVFRVIFYTF